MDNYLAGSAIQAGATVAAGALTSVSNANLSKKNQKWQEKMVKQQREYEQKLYEERFTPAAQVQALRNAGLNPMGQTSTMNVGTSSSVPTPATLPSDYGFVGRAGEAIASGLHAREAMKLQREQFNQLVTEQNRQFLLDLKASNLSEAETKAIIESKIAETEGSKLDNKAKQINLKMLEDFLNAGGNSYQDSSDYQHAQTNFINVQSEYQRIINSNADEKEKADIKAKLASAAASYASASLASAQSEVAKSQKIKIDAETQIANNEDGRRAAMHTLELYEQKLINAGLQHDNVRKAIENVRSRILNGDVRTFGELGQFLYEHMHSLIPFSSSPLKFAE